MSTECYSKWISDDVCMAPNTITMNYFGNARNKWFSFIKNNISLDLHIYTTPEYEIICLIHFVSGFFYWFHFNVVYFLLDFTIIHWLPSVCFFFEIVNFQCDLLICCYLTTFSLQYLHSHSNEEGLVCG